MRKQLNTKNRSTPIQPKLISQGAGLGIARIEIQAPPYALIAKSSIKSLKDLKGKVISVGGPKYITRIYVDRMLAPHGLKTGDYDYVYAGAPTARAQALLGGAVGILGALLTINGFYLLVEIPGLA